MAEYVEDAIGHMSLGIEVGRTRMMSVLNSAARGIDLARATGKTNVDGLLLSDRLRSTP